MADDALGFAGIAPPALRLYPVVSHVAEKLHALTLPRPRPNTRVRDLPDIALLATTGTIKGTVLWRAIETTFGFRRTHPIPTTIWPPPAFWEASYAAMATADELPWTTLAEVTQAVTRFLDPILKREECGVWEPDSWSWSG